MKKLKLFVLLFLGIVQVQAQVDVVEMATSEEPLEEIKDQIKQGAKALLGVLGVQADAPTLSEQKNQTNKLKEGIYVSKKIYYATRDLVDENMKINNNLDKINSYYGVVNKNVQGLKTVNAVFYLYQNLSLNCYQQSKKATKYRQLSPQQMEYFITTQLNLLKAATDRMADMKQVLSPELNMTDAERINFVEKTREELNKYNMASEYCAKKAYALNYTLSKNKSTQKVEEVIWNKKK